MAKTIPACGEPSPNDKNGPCPTSPEDHPQPCWCREGLDHRGAHECRCGEEWPSKPQRELMDLVERITVTEVRPGDVLVFETDDWLSGKELESFREGIREGVAEDVRVMVVERGRFAGVIRRAASPLRSLEWMSGKSCPKREGSPLHECVRPSCHDREHECRFCGQIDGPRMVDVSTLADVAAGRTVYITAEPTR